MKRTTIHSKILNELQDAESLVQNALRESMVKVIALCPKKFHKTIMTEYQELYLSKTIRDAFGVVSERTDLFIPAKDEGVASIAIFKARFGATVVKKKDQ